MYGLFDGERCCGGGQMVLSCVMGARIWCGEEFGCGDEENWSPLCDVVLRVKVVC